MYGNTVSLMDSVSVNKFRDTLRDCVERVINQHVPLKVTRRNGKDFVIVSAEDWEREQETLYLRQNSSLMNQISESLSTYIHKQGDRPTQEQINEILNL